MNEIFEKIYNDNNTDLNESSALFEKVYTEAEMLNEMNPKLRALLAAGLIGTASLGAASCSMPTDDPSDNGGEKIVTFENLRDSIFANSDEGNDIIAKLKTVLDGDIVFVGANESVNNLGMNAIFVYDRQSKSFEEKTEGKVGFSGLMFMYQASDSNIIGYIIPVDMKEAFATVITDFNN